MGAVATQGAVPLPTTHFNTSCIKYCASVQLALYYMELCAPVAQCVHLR